MAERRGPTKERKDEAPTTTVKGQSGGRMNRRLKMLSDMYIERHPGKATRWVYSPEHKPDLSNVLSRQADGYELVFNKDLGDDFTTSLPGLKKEDPVRIGDVVLMAIAAEVKAAFQRELDERATADRDRVQQEFYGKIEDMEVPGMRDEHRARPRGRSLIEEVERDVDVDESLKDE
jgi:hypothetical protein